MRTFILLNAAVATTECGRWISTVDTRCSKLCVHIRQTIALFLNYAAKKPSDKNLFWESAPPRHFTKTANCERKLFKKIKVLEGFLTYLYSSSAMENLKREMQSILRLKELLKGEKDALVGLEHLIYIKDEPDLSFVCSLCSKKGDGFNILSHIKSSAHKNKFLVSKAQTKTCKRES